MADPAGPPPQGAPRGRRGCIRTGCLWAVGVFVVLAILRALLGDNDQTPTERAEKRQDREQAPPPEEQEVQTVGPPPTVKGEVAEIYVLGASGGDYWISWYDDTGDVGQGYAGSRIRTSENF